MSSGFVITNYTCDECKQVITATNPHAAGCSKAHSAQIVQGEGGKEVVTGPKVGAGENVESNE